MAEHILLPSGATADLRDVADVTERQRRPIKRIQAQLTARPAFNHAVRVAQGEQVDGSLNEDQQNAIGAGLGDAFDLLEALNDALVLAMVRGWSYDFRMSEETIQDVPGRDLDALRKACSPYLTQLMPDFEPTPDPASPIVPSTA